MALVLISMALAGCETSGNPPASQLPPVPTDIQMCFRASAAVIPERALTVYDVESLWKVDRVRFVVMKKCGVRLIAWYNELRVSWK